VWSAGHGTVTSTKSPISKTNPKSAGWRFNLKNQPMKSKQNLKRNRDFSLQQLVLMMNQTPLFGASGQHEKEVKLATSLALGTGLHFDDVMLLTWPSK